MAFQLIRTTYWTRFDDDERFDEKDEVTKHEVVSSTVTTNGNYLDNMSVEWEEGKPKQSMLRQFATWFCGIKSTGGERESENKIKIATIEQSRRAKALLLACLLLVVCVAVAIFVTLSIPGWWEVIL